MSDLAEDSPATEKDELTAITEHFDFWHKFGRDLAQSMRGSNYIGIDEKDLPKPSAGNDQSLASLLHSFESMRGDMHKMVELAQQNERRAVEAEKSAAEARGRERWGIAIGVIGLVLAAVAIVVTILVS